jgi:hypothetical protein
MIFFLFEVNDNFKMIIRKQNIDNIQIREKLNKYKALQPSCI